jgi:biopolymer transport protein ExbB
MGFIKFIVSGFQSTGSVMQWAILVCMCAGVALILERVWFLFIRCGRSSGGFMAGIGKYIKQGDYAKALQYAKGTNTPLAKTVAAILENRGKGPKVINRAVEEILLTETPRVQRNLAFMAVIANIATLLGLMGTIYGLMVAFDAIANVPAAQRAAALANGIAFAMSTTLFGLITAVPILLFQGLLIRKSDRIIEEIDEKTTKLTNIVEE